MNKAELTEKLAERCRLTRAQAHDVVTTIFDGETGILARELAAKRGGVVKLAGFGGFEVRTLGARKHRNPATGEEFDAPERRVVRFRPGQNLSDKVKG